MSTHNVLRFKVERKKIFLHLTKLSDLFEVFLTLLIWFLVSDVERWKL